MRGHYRSLSGLMYPLADLGSSCAQRACGRVHGHNQCDDFCCVAHRASSKRVGAKPRYTGNNATNQ